MIAAAAAPAAPHALRWGGIELAKSRSRASTHPGGGIRHAVRLAGCGQTRRHDGFGAAATGSVAA